MVLIFLGITITSWLVKTQTLEPQTPTFLMQEVCSGDRVSVFPTHFQELLLLLVPGTHLENSAPRFEGVHSTDREKSQ